MIKNTYADCKILNTKVTGSTAYVTLLIYSNKAADTHKCFRFFLSDTLINLSSEAHNSQLLLLSNNTYWIDRTNNYENVVTSVDVNMYKEVILEIDITSQNMGEIRDNRWVRECQIVMMDVTNASSSVAWVSNVLTLISTKITLPQIKNLSFFSDKTYKLTVDFDYIYPTQEDFNYQSRSLYAEISTVSNNTRRVLETITVKEYAIKDGHVRVTFDDVYNDYVRVNVTLKNYKDVAMMSLEKLYRPQIRLESTYIKHNGILYRVNYIYYKGDSTIYGGPVLNE